MRISDWSSDVCSSDLLPNGMKYALLHNETPRDSVIIRMRFDVGSFDEANDQRGLAHCLEHMAINGSPHVPEGEKIKLLARKGIAISEEGRVGKEGVSQCRSRWWPKGNNKKIMK